MSNIYNRSFFNERTIHNEQQGMNILVYSLAASFDYAKTSLLIYSPSIRVRSDSRGFSEAARMPLV